MASSFIESIKCPSCKKTMTAKILQCLNGHSFCGECSEKNRSCTICTGIITTIRNLPLEKLIQQTNSKLECAYRAEGCKYTHSGDKLESHIKECRFRIFTCEGKNFCEWNCAWKGSFKEILTHFQSAHVLNSDMQYNSEYNIGIDFTKNSKDIKIIDFGNGSQIFWYKHNVDIKEKKCYWVFQCVGSKAAAAVYYYEFEIYLGSIRKLKTTEICRSDIENVQDIFDSESCVCVSFQTLSNFVKDDRLTFRFRIMKDKGIPVSAPPLAKRIFPPVPRNCLVAAPNSLIASGCDNVQSTSYYISRSMGLMGRPNPPKNDRESKVKGKYLKKRLYKK